MRNKTLVVLFLFACITGTSFAGNTVMEPSGMLSEQFNVAVGLISTPFRNSNAPGASTSGNTSVYVTPSIFGTQITASFTPGVTPVNYSPDIGVDYGNGHYSTGASHAATNGTGLYNIYITLPDTLIGGVVNIGLTDIAITYDGGLFEKTFFEVDLLNLWQDKWSLLATVPMTSGMTYTVTTSTSLGIGQVHGGLMFEPVAVIPEPSTYAAIFGGLVLVGAFVYRRRSRGCRSV